MYEWMKKTLNLKINLYYQHTLNNTDDKQRTAGYKKAEYNKNCNDDTDVYQTYFLYGL